MSDRMVVMQNKINSINILTFKLKPYKFSVRRVHLLKCDMKLTWQMRNFAYYLLTVDRINLISAIEPLNRFSFNSRHFTKCGELNSTHDNSTKLTNVKMIDSRISNKNTQCPLYKALSQTRILIKEFFFCFEVKFHRFQVRKTKSNSLNCIRNLI